MVFIALYLIPAASANWELTFVERDNMNSGAGDTSVKLNIWANDTRITSYSISADGSYGNLTINMTDFLSSGSTLTFQVDSTAGDKIGVVIKDINLTHNGYPVKFTPWTITGESGYSRAFNVTDDHLLIIQRGTGNINTTSSPIVDVAELAIKQSDLNFNKKIYNISQDDDLQINITVRNDGLNDETGAVVRLYINDVLEQTSSSFSVPSGSSYNVTFNYNVDFGTVNTIKVKALVIPSVTDGQRYNNYAVKYIIKQRPLFFTHDWDQIAGKINIASEPYATWKSELEGKLSSYNVLSTDYASSSTLESTKARNAMLAALYYQLTGNTQYAGAAVSALINIGNGQIKTGVQFSWADRDLDGNVIPNSSNTYVESYGWATGLGPGYSSAGDYGVDPGSWTIPYAIAYDMLHDYMKSTSDANLTKARNKLANMSISFYTVSKEIDSYGDDSTSGKGYSAIFWRDDNPVHAIASFGMLALSILDYSGDYQDVYGYPDRWIEYVDDDLLLDANGHSRFGTLRGSIENEHDSTGQYQDGIGYEDYFEPDLILYLTARSTALEDSYIDSNPLVKGKLYSHVDSVMPNGIPSNDDYGIAPIPYMVALENIVLEGDSRKKANWIINHSIRGTANFGDKYRKVMMNDWDAYYIGLFIYNHSESKTPSEASYVFENSQTGEKGQVRLRGDWTGVDDVYVSFRNKKGYQIGVTCAQSNHLAFDIWAKNAYLVPAAGDVRFLNDDAGYSKGWRGGFTKTQGRNMYLVNEPSCTGTWCALTRLSGGSQYDYHYNFAFINETLLVPQFKFAEGTIANVNRVSDQSDQQSGSVALSNTFDFTRDLAVVGNEYVVLWDTLEGQNSNAYQLMIPFGSTHQDDYTPSADHFINGTIYLDNGSVNHIDWYNTGSSTLLSDYNTTYTPNTRRIIWSTYSENTVSPYTSNNVVNMTVAINPTSTVVLNASGMRYGNYGWTYESYHPFAQIRQDGKKIKFLVIYYPTNSTNTIPTITNITVTGGSGDEYATKLTRGSVTDIMSISDGETITADAMTTDAVIAFSRLQSGEVEYFFIRKGTTFSYSGTDRLSISSAPDYAFVSYEGNDIEMKIRGSGTSTITLKNLNPSKKYAVKRDGSTYSNWEMQNSNKDIAITSSLSEHTFEIYVTGDRTPQEPGDNGGSTRPPVEPPYIPPTCEELWECSEWSACESGVKTRTCVDKNNCGTRVNKSAEQMSCCERLEITVFPIEVRINNGTATSFIVSAQTDCNPDTVELDLQGIDEEWYSIEKMESSAPGTLDFNVSLDVPSDAESGKIYIVYQPVSTLISGPEYNSILEIVTPKSDKKYPDGQEPAGVDLWIILGVVMAIILAGAIIFLARFYLII